MTALDASEHVHWVDLDGGAFIMGSQDFYADEAPVRTAAVNPFSIARSPVTNRQFAAFIAATGYVTVAERPLPPDVAPADIMPAGVTPHMQEDRSAPGSLVFTPTQGPVDLHDLRQWWRWVPGASWRHPRGEGAGPDAARIPEHPVVHIAYSDALAFAQWCGGRLPTEAELEYAACGGARPAPYAWGSTRDVDGQVMANTWRGSFPYRNTGARGWIGTSPVGTFPPNGYGLYDTIGNVWEWTSTLYAPPATEYAPPATEAPVPSGSPEDASTPQGSACQCSPQASVPVPAGDLLASPGGDQRPAGSLGDAPHRRRVLKGGSHLCAPEYCLRYRPAARSPQSEDTGTTHIGFRVVRDRLPRS